MQPQHFGNRNSIPPAPDLSCTDVDYKGVIYGTQLAIHFMRKNNPPGGSIVATSSICGVHPIESLPEYSGAKAAVYFIPSLFFHFVPVTSRSEGPHTRPALALFLTV
jgi:short-subunit dehydrogenase